MKKPTLPTNETAHAGPEADGSKPKLRTRHRLLASAIDGLLGQDGKFNDGGSLYLQVRAGRGAWVFEKRDGASRRSIGLGACPPVTLNQARTARDAIEKQSPPRRRPTRAAAMLSPVIAPIVAPVTAAPTVSGQTFEKVAADFLEARNVQFSAEQLTRMRSMLDLHMTPIAGRTMIEIQSQEIADALRPIWNGSVDSTGRKLRPLIEKIFDAAQINPNPATLARLTNLVNGLPSKTATKTKSVAALPYAQVPALMNELAEDSGDVARLIRFIILTGVRVKEALDAQWSEINLTAKTWTIPAARMKMDVEHVVPLSDAALKILGPKGDGIIFRGTRFGREIGQNVALRFLKTFGRVDTEGESVTLHGFRSSLGTWAEELDPPFTPKVIHFNLAHYGKEDKISKAYLRGEHWEKRREMMGAWGAFATSK